MTSRWCCTFGDLVPPECCCHLQNVIHGGIFAFANHPTHHLFITSMVVFFRHITILCSHCLIYKSQHSFICIFSNVPHFDERLKEFSLCYLIFISQCNRKERMTTKESQNTLKVKLNIKKNNNNKLYIYKIMLQLHFHNSYEFLGMPLTDMTLLNKKNLCN